VVVEAGFTPNGEQFAEGSASDQAFTLGNPIDFAGNIRAIVQQEQANRSEDFNPAWWLRGKIDIIFHEAIHHEQPEEKQDFFYALRAAWNLVAYEQIDGEHNDTAYDDIRGCTHVFGSHTLTLSPLGVTLLDAMAEALDIPHTPRQAEFDISLFSSAATMERIEKGALYRSPSLDEVRRAITPEEPSS
jgi:hypothetical protein